jgi:hypothetical protein
LRELIADSKKLIALLKAILEKAEAKLVETPPKDAPEDCSEGV